MLDETPAGANVVGGERLLDLRDIQAVGNQLVWVNLNLVFTRDATEADHVRYVGHRLEFLGEYPILETLQLHQVIPRVGAGEGVKIDLAYVA